LFFCSFIRLFKEVVFNRKKFSSVLTLCVLTEENRIDVVVLLFLLVVVGKNESRAKRLE